MWTVSTLSLSSFPTNVLPVLSVRKCLCILCVPPKFHNLPSRGYITIYDDCLVTQHPYMQLTQQQLEAERMSTLGEGWWPVRICFLASYNLTPLFGQGSRMPEPRGKTRQDTEVSFFFQAQEGLRLLTRLERSQEKIDEKGVLRCFPAFDGEWETLGHPHLKCGWRAREAECVMPFHGVYTRNQGCSKNRPLAVLLLWIFLLTSLQRFHHGTPAPTRQ